MTAPPNGATLPAYLSIRELAAFTPWTEQAIRTMIRRGTFKRGVHYFQPFGRRGQVIFKWQAVVELIEGKVAEARPAVIDGRRTADVIPMPNGNVIDVEEATQAAVRMLA